MCRELKEFAQLAAERNRRKKKIGNDPGCSGYFGKLQNHGQRLHRRHGRYSEIRR